MDDGSYPASSAAAAVTSTDRVWQTALLALLVEWVGQVLQLIVEPKGL